MPTKPRHRTFSTTPNLSTTTVLQNPRTDDTGTPMTIDISPRAAHRLQQITSPSSSPSAQNLSHLGSLDPKSGAAASSSSRRSDHLRVTVTSGGCHGFQYLMSLEPADKISPEDDTVFVATEGNNNLGARQSDGEREGDKGKKGDENGKAIVVMDEPSLELLRGSTIDFTMELIGSQFKVVGNPRASSSCGCGTSFDVTD